MSAVDAERLMQENEQTFTAMLAVAEDHLRADDEAAGFVACELAAQFASHNHPGFFASLELEDLVSVIASRLAQTPPGSAPAPKAVETVLHVMTEAYPTGGHSRLVQRWIEQDPSRRHSLVVTSPYETIPDWLVAAVRSASGTVTQLLSESDLTARVESLRAISAAHDITLLSTHPFDCLPLMAFGGRTDRPPVAFIDHRDHVFWVGRQAADLVVHLGDAGRRLGERRRGLSPSSTTVLPIPLGRVTRALARGDAKAAFGLRDSNLVLCTTATGQKYTQLGDVNFLDLVTDVVVRHPEVVLLAAGVEPNARWDSAAQATGGRIRALGLLENVEVQLDAADIYLDSYPVASNTSLLEAGVRATPVVVFDPGPPSLGVLRAGEPGSGGGVSRARDVASYQATLEELIADGALRHRSGAQLADEVAAAHTGPGWLTACERVYSSLVASPRGASPGGVSPSHLRDELDEALSRLAREQPHSLERLVALRVLRSARAVALPSSRAAAGVTRQIAEGNAFGLETRLADVQAAADGLKEERAELQAGIEAMAAYIDALHHTVSWRATAPLRRLRPRRRQR